MPKGRPRERTEDDPLGVLSVIRRLEVGPVRLEKKRIIAPYTVIQNGVRDVYDFEYRFEETVFDPGEPASLNVASVMAAQVALNYGLFCDEIVFHGLFDRRDRRFIQEMADNTAREIYVKKFLEPNPFLLKGAAKLPPLKREKYLRAELIFSNDELRSSSRADDVIPKLDAWTIHRTRHAILSSGGKDSLLSYGLLREMGCETHPIFINESGRHWFTALNAYRHFKSHVPETARVWTNSDRVFAWMLRHFPFIRQDFAQLRSDEYPLRLWTVAVFLFGALPLLRKRGIGRLIIGDEYDTTRRLSHKGIPHYDGLYDQSMYFDNALTRYFGRKNWGVTQFSIVRSLSEMLIEKILAERYPELQQHQVSCHAAHKEGERIHPCGRCEKCRRIVGMLKALGADPGLCGYSKNQIEYCLKSLTEKEVHQEAAGAQHMMSLLAEKNIFPKAFGISKGFKQHPEILKLRIDPERSPIEGIPVDLRQPLFNIFLKHAEGAVRRSGRVWLEFDPLSDPALVEPYPFENPKGEMGPPSSDGQRRASQKSKHILAELTWPEAKERLKEVDVALLPVGSVEQHGLHLPLDTDAFDADYLARRVAETCSDPKPLVLPLIPYGVSYHHEDFVGTISISNDTLGRLVYDIGVNAARHGITKLVIINGHGGNTPALQFAAQMINRDAHIFTCVDSGESSDADIAAMIETPNDVHAGEIETSTSLATRPHLVDVEKARKFVPHFSSRYLNFSSKRSVEWYARTAKISKAGVLGDPKKASRQKGERIWDVMIKNLVEFVEDLKSMTLDEIYEKRY
ncbi:MAG: creatininase family protein [Gemmatimonadota bacterium]|nr:MAG: creatininase family protein [Gemmatimonadota bacterium]